MPGEGNWKVRLYERVRERGYDSLTAFAEARPTASLVAAGRGAWARTTSPGCRCSAGCSPRRSGVSRSRALCAMCLCANCLECLPNGWPAVLDDANRFKVAMALGSWFAYTPETHEERVEQARRALLATPPPPGWRPLGPDDELLLTLLPDEEA